MTFFPGIKDDDFIGVQNYARSVYGKEGELPVPENAELTEMGYEYYPEGLEHVIRKVAEVYKGTIYVTENGIATKNDERRIAFIKTATQGVHDCISDGIPVKGYFYWSMIDNYEWQSGYSMHFGVMELDRINQVHTPKESLFSLGKMCGH